MDNDRIYDADYSDVDLSEMIDNPYYSERFNVQKQVNKE